jgi:phosphatidylcholine synthase
MKNPDNTFAGFPACWNMVALVVFALSPPMWVILLLVVALAIAMFTPLKFVHPVRTGRWRAVTLPVAFVWTFFAAWAAWVDFTQPAWASTVLMLASLYLVLAGPAQQLMPLRRPGGSRVV